MSVVSGPLPPASATRRGTMSAADKEKLDLYPANPDDLGGGVVEAVTDGNGLTLTTGTLAMGAAGAAASGAVTTGAQAFAGAKTLSGAILNGITTIAEAVTSLVRATGAALVLRSNAGALSTDVAVRVGTEVSDGSTHASAKLVQIGTGIGGTFVEYLALVPKAAAFSAALRLNLGSGTHRWAMEFVNPGAGEAPIVWQSGNGNVKVGQISTNGAGMSALHRPIVFHVNGNADAPAATEGFRHESAQNPSRVVHRVVAPAAQTAAVAAWRVGSNDVSAMMPSGDVESFVSGAGVVLRSPNGTRWRITIDNSGALAVAAA